MPTPAADAVQPVPADDVALDRSRQLVNWLVIITVIVCFAPRNGGPADWQLAMGGFVLAIVLEALPWVLLGALIAGLIETWIPNRLLPRLVQRSGRAGIPLVALCAPVFPSCECGVVPIARGLRRKGLPLPHTVTYLLIAPIANPVVIATTWIAFQDASMAVARVAWGLVVAIGAGLLLQNGRVQARLGLTEQAASGTQTAAAVSSGCGHDHDHDHDHDHGCGHDHGHDHGHGQMSAWRRFGRHLSGHVFADFSAVMSFFLMGVLIAAAMRTFVAGDLLNQLGDGLVTGPAILMTTAFVLSLCSEADAFLAVTFEEFSTAALLAFLVFGPMCDIKLLLMYRALFRPKVIFAIVVFLVVSNLGIAVLWGLLA